MRCQFCGTELGSASRCSICHKSAADVATGVLTPIPEAPTRFAGAVPDAQEAATDAPQDQFTRIAHSSTGDAPQDEFTRIAHPSTGAGSAEEPPTTFSEPAADATKMIGAPPPTSGASQSRQKGESGPLKVGEAFGPRYHIIRMLGIGGMGAVYQAWDAELGVSVAIKVIRPEAMADPEAAAEIERRFKRELLLARLVTHKNVVRIHDIGEVNGIKYITMPFVDGDDVATIVKKSGRLPIATVLRIARSVTSGLVAAHAADVVHRDLKPANIMVDADGEAMIMDFGIARSTGGAPKEATLWQGMPSQVKRSMPAFAEATTYGAVVGTVEYMAPEQAKGQAVDQRADIYAFGLILYDLLVGRRRAAHAVSAIAELQGRMEKAPPPPRSIEPDIPEALERIVLRCIEPDAAKRYQTTVELEAELNRLDDEGKPIPIPARYGWKLMTGVGTVVLALVGATWWFTRTTPPPKQHDPVSVLIADFENKTNEPTFDHTLESVFKLALEGAGFVSAYDRTGMRNLGVRAPEKLDERAAQEIAVKQALGVVLSGSLTRESGGYAISVKAAQAVTGNVITSATKTANDKDQVLSVATKLATTVRKALGDDTSDSAQRFAMDTLSAGNLDAVHEYALGQEALSNNKSDEAIGHYAKATGYDPNFAAAYTGLALASGNIGRQQDAEKYANEALRHLDSMTERERYRTRGTVYRVTGDYQHCVEEYSALVARYAADAAARNQLALCMSNLRQFPAARTEMQRAADILPKRALYRINLALYASYDSDFQEGEAAARIAQELSPSGEYAFVAVAFSQLGQGQIPQAIDTYQKLAKVSPLGASLAASGLGDVALYEGRFADAAKVFEEGAAADAAARNTDRAAAKLASLAYTRLLQKQRPAAIAALDKALASSQIVKIRFLAARLLVEAGDVAKAKTLAAGLAAELQGEPQALGKILEGEIALKNNDPRTAVKLLMEANQALDTWIGRFDLGRAYLESGAFLQADSEFDRCIKRRRGEALSLMLDEEPTFGYLPPAYYYQGRVREALKTEKYIESYRAYLDIRGKAKEDPLLPEIRRRAGL